MFPFLSFVRKTFLPAFLLLLAASCHKDKDKDNEPAPVANPEITAVTPAHALKGASISITGKNFSTTTQENEVRFSGNNAVADVLDASATTLTVRVPETAITGKISITVNNRTVTSTQDFVVDEPVLAITEFQPKQGPFGTTVVISGTKFGDDVKVTLNNVEATILEKTAAQIRFLVPTNTTLVKHKIRIVSDGAAVESADEFTVTAAGPYAQWVSKPVNAAPANIYTHGVSFVWQNKIYWGFTKLSALQNEASYMVLDPAAAQPTWTMGNPPPQQMAPPTQQSAMAVVHNNKVYFGTGLTPNASNKWWLFDPAQNTAQQQQDFPVSIANGVAFTLNGNLYAGGGGTNKTFHQFHPGTNTWTPAFTGNFRELTRATAFVIGNEAFLGPALLDPGGERKFFYRCNGTSLEAVTPLPVNASAPAVSSFTIGNKGYIALNAQVWEYTPGGNGGTWRAVLSQSGAPLIAYTANVLVNGLQQVLGWTNKGELFELRMN